MSQLSVERFQLAANEAQFPLIVVSQCQSAVAPQLPAWYGSDGAPQSERVNKAARSPIEGICRSTLMPMFTGSANALGALPGANTAKTPNC